MEIIAQGSALLQDSEEWSAQKEACSRRQALPSTKSGKSGSSGSSSDDECLLLSVVGPFCLTMNLCLSPLEPPGGIQSQL